jgi:hypothetical protein
MDNLRLILIKLQVFWSMTPCGVMTTSPHRGLASSHELGFDARVISTKGGFDIFVGLDYFCRGHLPSFVLHQRLPNLESFAIFQRAPSSRNAKEIHTFFSETELTQMKNPDLPITRSFGSSRAKSVIK